MRRPFLLGVTTICLLTSGCGLSIGPQTNTEVVVLKAGVPVRILDNKTVRVRTLAAEKVADVENAKGGGITKQDIGGWVAMPPEHWEVIEKKLLQAKVVEKAP
jgi:hypothetical protein